MKASTISYFIGAIGFVFMGLSFAFVSGTSSAIVGVIILVVGAFLIRAGYQDYKDKKKQDNYRNRNNFKDDPCCQLAIDLIVRMKRLDDKGRLTFDRFQRCQNHQEATRGLKNVSLFY
jgi:hypothetical protein